MGRCCGRQRMFAEPSVAIAQMTSFPFHPPSERHIVVVCHHPFFTMFPQRYDQRPAPTTPFCGSLSPFVVFFPRHGMHSYLVVRCPPPPGKYLKDFYHPLCEHRLGGSFKPLLRKSSAVPNMVQGNLAMCNKQIPHFCTPGMGQTTRPKYG